MKKSISKVEIKNKKELKAFLFKECLNPSWIIEDADIKIYRPNAKTHNVSIRIVDRLLKGDFATGAFAKIKKLYDTKFGANFENSTDSYKAVNYKTDGKSYPAHVISLNLPRFSKEHNLKIAI